MSKIKSESKIEILLLEFVGLCLRKHPRGIFGNPDFGNKKRKIALFIDGCFWHKCRKHYKRPKTNKKFWDNKILRNKKRDKIVNKKLRSGSWIVIRIWEHQIRELGKYGKCRL